MTDLSHHSELAAKIAFHVALGFWLWPAWLTFSGSPVSKKLTNSRELRMTRLRITDQMVRRD